MRIEYTYENINAHIHTQTISCVQFWRGKVGEEGSTIMVPDIASELFLLCLKLDTNKIL